MASKKEEKSLSPRIVNRKARHEYHVLESLEVGIELTGSEVKSIRSGQVSLAEGFARIDADRLQLELHQVDISPYVYAHGVEAHEPRRVRRLLAHRRQIKQLLEKVTARGLTLAPLTMYFLRGRVKLELGLCQGKKAFDKRQDLKKRQDDRDMRRSMTKKFL